MKSRSRSTGSMPWPVGEAATRARSIAWLASPSTNWLLTPAPKLTRFCGSACAGCMSAAPPPQPAVEAAATSTAIVRSAVWINGLLAEARGKVVLRGPALELLVVGVQLERALDQLLFRFAMIGIRQTALDRAHGLARLVV